MGSSQRSVGCLCWCQTTTSWGNGNSQYAVPQAEPPFHECGLCGRREPPAGAALARTMDSKGAGSTEFLIPRRWPSECVLGEGQEREAQVLGCPAESLLCLAGSGEKGSWFKYQTLAFLIHCQVILNKDSFISCWSLGQFPQHLSGCSLNNFHQFHWGASQWESLRFHHSLSWCKLITKALFHFF